VLSLFLGKVIDPTMISIDSETCLFRPGCMAPPVVCVTYAGKSMQGEVLPGILHWTQAEPLLGSCFENQRLVIGQNIAYDACCFMAQWPDLVPLIFQAYQEDRVSDTKVRQQLLDIAAGCYRGVGRCDGVNRPMGCPYFDSVLF